MSAKAIRMDRKRLAGACLIAFGVLHIVLKTALLVVLITQRPHYKFIASDNYPAMNITRNSSSSGSSDSVEDIHHSGQMELAHPEMWLTFFNCSPKFTIQENPGIYLSTCANNTDIVDLRAWHNAHPTAAGVTLTVNSFEGMCSNLLVRRYFHGKKKKKK